MDKWNDDELVASVAADYIGRYGPRVLEHLLEMEEAARLMGDELSADAWLAIAQSAAEQMKAARGRR